MDRINAHGFGFDLSLGGNGKDAAVLGISVRIPGAAAGSFYGEFLGLTHIENDLFVRDPGCAAA